MKENTGSRSPALDWSTEFGVGQWEATIRSYQQIEAFDIPSLKTRYHYIPFARDVCPDALKRFRLWTSVVGAGFGLEESVTGLGTLYDFHYYCISRNLPGIRYALNRARMNGSRRSDAADMITLAWLHGGPATMNSAAEVLHDYMADWDPAADGPGYPWPADWSVDPDAFSSGVDLTLATDRNEMSPDDRRRIEAWHVRVEGEVPEYVTFLADRYPLALRAFRARFETATRRSLPKQFIALCWVHLAGAWGQPAALRRALHMAREFGVRRPHVIHALSLNQMFLGHVGMEANVQGVGEILDRWP